MKSIPDYPELHPNIINAIEDGSLVLFIGAGVSAQYGYPLWGKLAQQLVEEGFNNHKITEEEKCALLSGSFDSLKQVTIACKRLGDGGSGVEYIADIFNERPENKPENYPKLEKIAHCLSAFNSPIVTTNADLSLDCITPFKDGLIVSSFKNWNENCRQLALIHLHGSIREPENMVFTSDSYARAYRATDKEFGTKLIDLLKGYSTILFIGYGLNEFELIKYFISDADSVNPNRFFLNAYRNNDVLAMQLDEEYYKSLGITLIPYIRDDNNYEALLTVLERWDNTIRTETMAHIRIPQMIKEICDKEPTDEGVKIIEGFLNGQYS